MNIKDPLNIIICGVGGQGNVLLSRLLARIFVKKGFHASIGETFGTTQRGGVVMSHLRAFMRRSYGVLIPLGHAHVILSLEPMETIRVLGSYGNPRVEIISNTHPVYPMPTITGDKDYPDIEDMKRVMREASERCWFLDATQIGLEMGNPVLTNMIMMGALVETNVLDVSRLDVEDIVRKTFSGQVAEINILAVSRGMEAVSRQRN